MCLISFLPTRDRAVSTFLSWYPRDPISIGCLASEAKDFSLLFVLQLCCYLGIVVVKRGVTSPFEVLVLPRRPFHYWIWWGVHLLNKVLLYKCLIELHMIHFLWSLLGNTRPSSPFTVTLLFVTGTLRHPQHYRSSRKRQQEDNLIRVIRRQAERKECLCPHGRFQISVCAPSLNELSCQ